MYTNNSHTSPVGRSSHLGSFVQHNKITVARSRLPGNHCHLPDCLLLLCNSNNGFKLSVSVCLSFSNDKLCRAFDLGLGRVPRARLSVLYSSIILMILLYCFAQISHTRGGWWGVGKLTTWQ